MEINLLSLFNRLKNQNLHKFRSNQNLAVCCRGKTRKGIKDSKTINGSHKKILKNVISI